MDDTRFWVLEEALSSYASDPDDPPLGGDERLRAAVSVIVRGRRRLDLLLIKRAEHPGDPWSGHMALPGGRWEEPDRTLLHTAMRETSEETGVELHEAGVHLGRLEEVTPVSAKLPSLTIHPFVFGVPAATDARVASVEVESVHWVSLHELRSPDAEDTVEITLPGGSRRFPCLRVAGQVVWGLTYRILCDFFDVFPDGELERRR